MSSPKSSQSKLADTSVAHGSGGARAIYDAVMDDPFSLKSKSLSRTYLQQQLNQAEPLPCDLPLRRDALTPWIEREAMAVGEDYARYLEARKAGQPRRYFSCRSHALSFLQRVAPTKLVDGAWLYGVLHHWRDNRFYSLIRTYLEELGDGNAERNHVALYQRLLAENGCEMLPELSDEYYVQGALQLALGHHADEFMPELIGYNLGYEQLPLHLLITAFELNELKIDPYYFTLHITIDNAGSGHARKAVQSVLDVLPRGEDGEAFLARVASGYRLNGLGLSTQDVIDSFDIDQELVAMLERKSVFGRYLHSDFCRIGGRTVNEWLASPHQIRMFLKILEQKSWIKRHEDPGHSRFWRLVEGPDARMFGVFNPFEKQLLHDWIAGDFLADATKTPQPATRFLTSKIFRRHRPLHAGQKVPAAGAGERPGDIDHDANALRQELRLLPEEARIQQLIRLMAPSSQATATGLLATRLFSASLG